MQKSFSDLLKKGKKMKKVGFIGAFDKTNLLMYVAKMLKYMKLNVLVLDTSILQKTKYVVPSISPTKSYISNLEGIDFASGFTCLEEVARYLGIDEEKMTYDYVLIDIDSQEILEKIEFEQDEKRYFVTSFDLYSLKKGLSLFENLPEPIRLTKVLSRFEIQKEDEDYLDYLTMGHKINWNESSIYLPNFDEDNQVIEENQKIYTIRFKRLSAGFQEGIMYIVQEILDEKNINPMRKALRENEG